MADCRKPIKSLSLPFATPDKRSRHQLGPAISPQGGPINNQFLGRFAPWGAMLPNTPNGKESPKSVFGSRHSTLPSPTQAESPLAFPFGVDHFEETAKMRESPEKRLEVVRIMLNCAPNTPTHLESEQVSFDFGDLDGLHKSHFKEFNWN
eukprot:Platyproteum_vivax@DN12354_c0_g1_i1.p1